ncbi:hypothetical protein CJ030_MR3G011163 [Morella rubra]|uniref:Uncharacterized protein n=1 Tax=Morella rubra TaxID=262757 RepID=A0A6A1W645_9ROSI|nr:hypothetical protein CJ030_MR3G011163 [Morella rubra]
MSVEVLDAATIYNFVVDEEAFNVSVADRFARLDTDRNVDLEEFKEETKRMMLAVANGMKIIHEKTLSLFRGREREKEFYWLIVTFNYLRG